MKKTNKLGLIVLSLMAVILFAGCSEKSNYNGYLRDTHEGDPQKLLNDFKEDCEINFKGNFSLIYRDDRLNILNCKEPTGLKTILTVDLQTNKANWREYY